jgi:hypothetical protein
MSFFIYNDKFNANHVHFGAVTPNAINSGKFSRLAYSTNHITLNNAGFVLNMRSVRSVYHHANNGNGNKYSVTYDATYPEHASNVDNLRAIEQLILDKYVMQQHAPELRRVYSISDRLHTGHITVHDSSLFDTLGNDGDDGNDCNDNNGNNGNNGNNDDDCNNGNNGNNGNNDNNDDDCNNSNVCADSCNHGAFSFAVTIYGVWETQHACGLVHKFVKQ